MKTPPFVLGAALAFWGWQTGFLIPGLIMGLTLEASRIIPARLEFTDEDLTRIWILCLVILLAAVFYAFTVNEGPSEFRGFFQSPNYLTQRTAGIATSRTTWALFRWLPMTFFCFAFAQAYNSRETIPLHVISIIQRHRWKTARKLGLPAPINRSFNVSYPYLGVCLVSASAHASDDSTFFWGFCVLVGWALWPHRSPRFGLALWTSVLAMVIVLSYFGQRGIGQLQSYIGNLNPQWLGLFARHRFDPTQSQTDIGRLGRIKTSPKIVIRLEAPDGLPPNRLREATYRSFKGRTWYAEVTENEFVSVKDTNETTFPLLDKSAPQMVKIACYLNGGKALLPLPKGVARLEHLLAYNVWKSPLGAVLEEGPGLVVFDALYGPGPTMDAPPGTKDEDLQIPERDQKAIEQIAKEVTLEGQNLDQAMQTLSRFFSGQFTYSTWFEQDRSSYRNETPLTRFLLHTRSGHCEYFATAAVLLLRKIGIPARYAVGYAVHEGSGQSYVVRQRDGHAWCLAWDARNNAWREFDPTPASWMAIDAQQMTLMQKLADIWARVSFEFSKFRWGQTHMREYLLLMLLPVLALLSYQIVFRRRRHGKKKTSGQSPAVDWPGLDSEFYDLEQKLAAFGLGRQPSEPLSIWLARVSDNERMGEITEPLRELLALHYRYRFDPFGLNVHDRERLRDETQACLQRIKETEVLVAH